MRHLFIPSEDEDETSDDERRARSVLLGRIDDLWRAVRNGESESSIDRAAAAVHPHLVCEVDAEQRLVLLTTRGEQRLRPLVVTAIRKAPHLEGWTFLDSQPPISFDDMLAVVREVTGRDLSEARARAGFQRGHLLDVVVYSRDCSGHGDERARDAAELAVEGLLGERIFEQWIGGVSVAPLPRGGGLLKVHDSLVPAEADTFPLVEVGKAIEAAIAGLREGLSEEPCHRRLEGPGWAIFELEPTPAHDYAARDDLAVATTMLPEMLKCYLEGATFHSSRFSRHEETFLAVKMDGNGRRADESLARRERVEAALNEELVPKDLGGVVGNGLGLRYAYVDLAVTDVFEGVAAIKRTLRGLEVPTRSWITFFDSSLEDEWVGVWPATPAPPLPAGA